MFIVSYLGVIIQQYFWPVDGSLGYGSGLEFDGQKGKFESYCLVITGNTVEHCLAVMYLFM